jgi:hypothetical protein
MDGISTSTGRFPTISLTTGPHIMNVKANRNRKTRKVDCIQLCPETQMEVSLVTLLVNDKKNFLQALYLLMKENSGRVEHVMTEQTELMDIEEYTHH